MWGKSKNQFCYTLSNNRRSKVVFSVISKKTTSFTCFVVSGVLDVPSKK